MTKQSHDQTTNKKKKKKRKEKGNYTQYLHVPYLEFKPTDSARSSHVT